MANTPSIVQTAQPFLLTVCRMPGTIAGSELKTIIDWGRLDPNSDIETISLIDEDTVDPASLGLSWYSGMIITGSPFGSGQDENRKNREYQVMERRIFALNKRLVGEDVLTLGICFGLQAVVRVLGGELVEGHGEDLQTPHMAPTPEAAGDPLTADMLQVFYGYTGCAEAVGDAPGNGVIFATGDYYRVQIVRWGESVYETQFHPEIIREGIHIRINTYGGTYYPADERVAVIAHCDTAEVAESNRLITKFVTRYSSQPDIGGDRASIAFRDSERSTVGLEWEVQIVDPETLKLGHNAKWILARVRRRGHSLVKGEIHQNILEFVSRKRASVAECAADTEEAIDAALPCTEELGVEFSSGGSYPFAHLSDQPVSETACYRELVERTHYWGRQVIVFGTHVHVSVEDCRKVAPVHNFLSAKIGHLLEISAASPYWDDIDTGHVDNRAIMFQQLPTAGLSMHLNPWGDLKRITGDLVGVGAIREYNEIRWDVQPSPGFDTIEVRACDSTTNLAEIRAITTSVHALVEAALCEFDAGRPLLPSPFHLLEANKWRGARYGAHAELVGPADGKCAPLTETFPDLLAWIEPAAEFLGYTEDLTAAPELIASSAADRLRAAAGPDGDLKVVAAHALAEFNADRPIQSDPVGVDPTAESP